MHLASTFSDKPTAEGSATATLRAYREEVLAFDRGEVGFIGPLRLSFGRSLGMARTRDGGTLAPNTCTVVLRRKDDAGFVYTAYPEPELTAPADFPTLDVYFGAYLHQDWMDEFSGPVEAFETLLPLLRPVHLRRMIEEFSALLERDDPALQDVMKELSLYLDTARQLGITERTWLRRLQDRASRELARRTDVGAYRP